MPPEEVNNLGGVIALILYLVNSRTYRGEIVHGGQTEAVSSYLIISSIR